MARALRELPVTRAGFERGELSFTQVRAITRIATPESEDSLVRIARSASGSQIERLTRGVTRARQLEADRADPEAAAHRMRTRVRYDEDGTVVVIARYPAEQAAVLLAALDAVRDQLEQSSAEDTAPIDAGSAGGESSAEDSRPPRRARASAGQALLHLARQWLQAQPALTRRRARIGLTAQIDPLSGWARLSDGELLPPAVAESLCATLGLPVRLRALQPTDLTRYDRRRTRRDVDQHLRDLLGVLDGQRCRFPGCPVRRHLDAHHVRWWSRGGATDLANLILLCARHHTLVHEDGFQLTLAADRTLTVTTSTGVPIPHHPEPPVRPAEELDPDGIVTPDTKPTPWTYDARMDLHYCVSVLMQHAA